MPIVKVDVHAPIFYFPKIKVMKINKEELYKLYMEWVDQVTEECDWKTSFGPEEIVNAIAHILETNPHLHEKEKHN
jgi:hypothetical protein